MAKPPGSLGGLRHVALYASDLEACEQFYVDLLGMEVEWRPDPDNVYLTSGRDNLALHRATEAIDASEKQVLDHIGFILSKPDLVDEWHEFLLENNVMMKTKPKTHRDGARSFYCLDPNGVTVQFIFHPPIADK